MKYQLDPPVATIKLDHPQTNNRISEGLAEELREVCRQLSQEESINLVVLTGTGDAFSVGRASVPADMALEERVCWVNRLRVSDAVASLPVPVLVALNGDALDHGLELALAGDLRIAVAGAKLGITDLAMPEPRFPWDGGTQRLPRLIGPAWAQDLILTSRIVEAE
ncbi:MAG: enoyl-CoA hydratase/isomerase family protein, partial [Dehalococcoidia bacterium]